MTYKYLKEHYPLAYNELMRCNKEFSYKASDERHDIAYACSWNKTPQGNKFWTKLNLNSKTSIEQAKKLHPELFTESTVIENSTVAMKILLLSGN